MASSDVNVINIKVLKQYHSNFSSEKSRFSNITYKTFSNSYINKCQDSYISSIARKLEKCYEEVEELYKKIDNWWESYNDEATNLENVLSGNNSSGILNEQGLREYSKCLPELKNYTVVFQDVVVEKNNSNIGYASPKLQPTKESQMEADRIKIQQEMSKQLSMLTAGTMGSIYNFNSYNNQKNQASISVEEYNNMKQELDTLKKEYNNNYNYYKYNKEEEKAHLAKQELLSKKISDYEQFIEVEDINQKIDSLKQELSALEKEYSNKHYQFKYRPEDGKENLAKQDALKEKISDYENLKRQFESKQLAQQDINASKPEEEKGFFEKWWDAYTHHQQLQNAVNIQVQQQTAATVALGFNSVVEGGGQAIEGFIDGLTIMGTMQQEQMMQQTAMTSEILGLINEDYNIMGFDATEELVQDMWKGTQEFVSTEYVSNAYNNLYENYNLGKFIYANAYNPEQTRAVLNGVGYFTTNVVAGGLTGVPPAVMVGISSTGKYTSEAWNDGAELREGIAYGFARGSYDSFEVVLGQKIGGLKLFNGFKNATTNQLLNSASHVVLDTLDGASGAFVDPILQMIYSPNENNIDQILTYLNYDEQGNQINNIQSWDELSYGEKYKALFEINGGWDTVKTNALFSGITSTLLGEVGDIAKSTQVDSIANSLSSGNKNVLDDITALDSSKLQDLINISSDRGIMNELVDSLDAKQLDRVVDSLTTSDIKRLVDANNANVLIDSLDDAQLEKIYDKIGDNANLKELKESIGKKIDDTTVKFLDDITDKILDIDDATDKILDLDDATVKSKQELEILDDKVEFLYKNLYDLKYRQYSLPRFVEGFLTSAYSFLGHMTYLPLKNNKDLCTKVLDKGIVHYTSDDAVAKILKSGYVKKSGVITSYGTKKSFFFVGEPEFKDVTSNTDTMSYKRTGVKIQLEESDLVDFNHRQLNDLAITHKGDYYFDPNKASQVYSVLEEQDGKLIYKDVTKEEYDAYIPSDKIKDIVGKEKNTLKASYITFCRQADFFNRDLGKLINTFKNAVSSKTNATVDGCSSVLEEYLKNTNDLPNTAMVKEALEIDQFLQANSSSGMSFKQYLSSKGIKVRQLQDCNDVAHYMGDGKLYLIKKVKELEALNNLKGKKQQQFALLADKYKSTAIGDLDVEQVFSEVKRYMTKSEIVEYKEIVKKGYIKDNQYTGNQLSSVFNYTACGGFEINAWLNDAEVGNYNQKARDRFYSIDTIQNMISGHKLQNGICNKNFTTNQGNILKELDSVISSANYDDAIVTYRGVKKLFNYGQRISVDDLRIGDSFGCAGYQSSSIIMENSFAKNNDVNIILEIVVPPKSGSAAYIENISGVKNYGQMEVLIKRDAEMVVVGDVYKKVINGVEKTVIPVVVK